MVPSTNATPKTTPPPAKPADAPQKPAAAPADAQPAQAQQPQPAQAPAAEAAKPKDGFVPDQPAQPTQRAQGDTFDKKSGGGLGDTLLGAAKAVAAPIVAVAAPVVQAVAPVVAPIAGAIGNAIAPAIDHLGALWDNKDTIGKLADIGQPGVVNDLVNPPDRSDPTKGMTADQRTAYDALPPDQKTRYDQLHAQASDTWGYRTVGPQATTTTPSTAVNHLRDMLTSGRMGDYLKVEDALKGPDQAAHLQDVQNLLFAGKLSDGKLNRDGQSTLDAMVDLSKGGTTPVGVDRTKLLGQLAHDIDHPEQIRQGDRNKDCGGTTAAFVMALTQPAEYARMIQGLGEKGQVELTPEWAKLFGAKSNVMQMNGTFDPNDTRSPTQQLFAKTFDQEAVHGQAPVTAPGQAAQATAVGITGDQLKNGLNDKGVLGGGWDAVYLPPAKDPAKPDDGITDDQRAQATQVATDMIKNATPQHPVMANIDHHWVTVLGVDKSGQVWVKDPMSGDVSQHSMDDVSKGLNTVVYQSAYDKGATPPDWMHNTAWAAPGGGSPTSGGLGSGGGAGSGTR